MKKKTIEPGHKKSWTKAGPGVNLSDEDDVWIDLSESGAIIFTREGWDKRRREIVGAPKEGSNVSNTRNRSSS